MNADTIRQIMALTCKHLNRTTWKSGDWACNDCGTQHSAHPERTFLG